MGLAHDSHSHSARALKKALAVTAVFFIVELLGGYLSNSLALLSDAAHMLGDVGALALSLFVAWLSERPANRNLSFGYHRVEILGALLSGVGIWVIAGGLIYEAIQRFSNPPEIQGAIVSGVAFVGLLANLVSMKMLHGAQHANLNVRAAYLHVAADALGSVGALVAGVVLVTTGWSQIDPLVTFLVAGLMIFSSTNLMREALVVLLESTPAHIDLDEVARALGGLSGVVGVHDLHVWSLSSGRFAMSAHLVTTNAQMSSATLERATRILDEKFGLHHTTLQVESSGSVPSDHCHDCSPD